MEKVQQGIRSHMKQVIFKLGEEEYGLDIGLVDAIEKHTGVIRVPNAPTCIKGIMDFRGVVIPVYSLRRKFGLPEKEIDKNTMLIVTKSKGIQMGYEVDEVKEILEIPEASISNPPTIIKNSNTSYIKLVANISNRMVILLDHDGIISSSEKENIETLVLN